LVCWSAMRYRSDDRLIRNLKQGKSGCLLKWQT
jgi:hypothetical protein